MGVKGITLSSEDDRLVGMLLIKERALYLLQPKGLWKEN